VKLTVELPLIVISCKVYKYIDQWKLICFSSSVAFILDARQLSSWVAELGECFVFAETDRCKGWWHIGTEYRWRL